MLRGYRVALIATDDVDMEQISSARRILADRGAEVELIAPHDGDIRAVGRRKSSELHTVDVVAYQADATDFDAALVPDGAGEWYRLDHDGELIALVDDLLTRQCAVAFLPQAGRMLTAIAVAGKRVTADRWLRERVRERGAHWTDEHRVVDGGLITTRRREAGPLTELLCQVLGRQPLPVHR